MRLVERAAGSCFELELNTTRLLLDFGGSAAAAAVLRYVPLDRPDALAATAAADADADSPAWRCTHAGGRWLVTGEVRLELPATESLDIEGIDAVLISSAEGMLTLPYLTEHTDFRGEVLATTAALHLGRLAMLELVSLREHALATPQAAATALDAASSSGAPPSVPVGVAEGIWTQLSRSRTIYSRADVESCVSKVRGLSYGEIARLDTGCTVTPESSGGAIGSAHWRIEEANDETFAYIAGGMLPPPQPHPQPPQPQPPQPQQPPQQRQPQPQQTQPQQPQPAESGGPSSDAALEAVAMAAFVGRHVRLCGLKSSATFNGMEGVVISFDEARSRLEVELPDGSKKMLLGQNLEILEHSPSQQTAPPSLTIAEATAAAVAAAKSESAAKATAEVTAMAVERESRLRRADAAASASRPMRMLRTLHGTEALLMTQLRAGGGAIGGGVEPPSSALARACAAAVATCAVGGNVLIPACPWSSSTLALIEAIMLAMASHRLTSVQLHLISPVGAASLVSGEILTEWLDMARQARAYVPTNPFDFETLQFARRLVVSSHLDQLQAPIQRPAIVVATHPSLRLGDAPTVLRHWRDDPRSLLLLTSPCADEELLLAPFQPMRMQVARCVIDPRLGPAEAIDLLDNLSPKRLILPSPPTASPQPPAGTTAVEPAAATPADPYVSLLDGRRDGQSCPWSISRLAAYDALELQTVTGYEVAFMPMRAAMDVNMVELVPGVNAGRFSGHLRYDDVYERLRLLPDGWVEPGHTASVAEQRRIDARVEEHRAFHEGERAYFGLVSAHVLVEDLRGVGVGARIRKGASDELTVVELLGEPYEQERFCIELRHGESTVAADYSGMAQMPDDYEERLALIQGAIEKQLVKI